MSYRFGDYALDTEAFALTRAGEPVSVEPRVFDLLAYLIQHRDRVVPKEELVEEVWSGAFITDAALKRAIVEARRAIGDDGRQQVAIQTLYGRGYRFVKEAAEEPAALPSRSPPAVRRWLIGLASLGVALLLVAAAVFLIGGWPAWEQVQPPVAPSPDRVAVLPFSVRSADDLGGLREDIVDLLSTNLDGAADLRSVDPRAVLSAADRAAGDLGDPEQASRIAASFGAGLYVVGNIAEADGRLRIGARLHGGRDKEGDPISGSVEGTAAELFELVDGLTAQLLAGRLEGPRWRISRLAARTTESIDALKAYLEGERTLWRRGPDAAIEPLQRAVEIDPTFALAHYRLAWVAQATDRSGELAPKAIDQALRHSGRVGRRTRRLIEALHADVHGRHAEAYRLYREIVVDYPDELEAWDLLGSLIFYRGSFLGRSWDEAGEAFEQTLALAPGWLPGVHHLASIAARRRRLEALDSFTERSVQLFPEHEWLARAQRAMVVQNAAEVERFVARLERAGDVHGQLFGGYLTWATGDLVVGRRLWRLLTDSTRAVGIRALAYMTLAKLEVTMGRRQAAAAEVEALEAIDRSLALEHRAYFALTPFLSVERVELEAIRRELLAWQPSRGSSSDPSEMRLVDLHAPVHPYLRPYLLGRLSLRLGDNAQGLRFAAELERMAVSASVPHFVADLARSVRMEAAWLEGRQEEALTILEGANFWRFVELKPDNSPFLSHAYERLARAELLYELGRWDEALRWHQVMADWLVYGGGLSHLRLAQLYERRGDFQEAAWHYERFVELWKDCDPELRPLVEEAKGRLAQLRSERGAEKGLG